MQCQAHVSGCPDSPHTSPCFPHLPQLLFSPQSLLQPAAHLLLPTTQMTFHLIAFNSRSGLSQQILSPREFHLLHRSTPPHLHLKTSPCQLSTVPLADPRPGGERPLPFNLHRSVTHRSVTHTVSAPALAAHSWLTRQIR